MSQDELVDIVDEKDQVLSHAPKKVAHERGFLHRCVIAEIIDSEGRWTLIKQAPGRQDQGQWVAPVGGHVQAGEHPDDALRREALEEVGLKDFKFKFIGKTIFNRYVEHLKRQENHYFLCYEIYWDGELDLNHESVEYKKFTRDELKQTYKNNPEFFGGAWAADIAVYPDLAT